MVARLTLAVSLTTALLVAGCGDSTPAKLDCSTNPAGCICTDDTNCGGANPRCDNHTGRCVPCLMFDDNCTGGTHCLLEGGNYMCAMGCVTKSDCPTTNGRQQECCDKTCIDVTASAGNCGTCGNACKDVANGTSACVGGGCVIGACKVGFDNCNGNIADGCETPTVSDPRHCGKCGNTCAVGANATAVCNSGVCGANCVQGYADCDGNLADGCEVDTSKDSKNCGACGTACGPLANSPSSVCMSGKCQPSMCTGWFGDCDHDPANGCEADTQNDAKNCGACGSACPVAANGTNSCTSGICGIARCNAGFGDCDKDNKTGCEKNLTADKANCGACGTICSGPNSMQDCQAGTCVIASCNQGGFTDCNKDVKDGCEINILSDLGNCNGCGMPCKTYPHLVSTCKLGVCGTGACEMGFSDCNKDINDGCEADLNSIQNCGGCGVTCPVYANASNMCLGAKCTIKACNPGFENCNNNIADGCEVNLQTDPKNCGICGSACTYRNAAGACGAGKCSMGACNQFFADCDKSDVNGCEQETGADPKNCGGCGIVCPNNAPNCVAGKCSNSVHNTKAWQGYNQFGAWGCFSQQGGGYPDDLDWIQTNGTWKQCLLEASKYGAMLMAPCTGDWSYPAWYGHRNGNDVFIGDCGFYQTSALGNNMTCVMMRPRFIQGRAAPLASSLSYDGNSWNYQDYGSTYYYECEAYAAKAGATIITPYTLGLGKGDDYWLGMVDICAMTAWTVNGGTDYSYEYPYDPDIGTQHKCMVGFIDN